jgi:hypothetical protein
MKTRGVQADKKAGGRASPPASLPDLTKPLTTADLDHLTDAQLLELAAPLLAGNPALGQYPIEIELERKKALDQPSHMAVSIDPWYEKHFEPVHYRLMNEVLAGWIRGEMVVLDGVPYNPKDFRGLLILWSRATLKSTILRLMAMWSSVYFKLELGVDLRAAYVHQVIEKAREHSEGMKETAKHNAWWRKNLPDFSPQLGKEWDTKDKWRYPNFKTYTANEFSWTFYGETSNKTGGHYQLRMVDDWVTDESATTPEQLDISERRFRAMDNLRDRNVEWNPWICGGTHYHYSDTYKRLMGGGGWLCWKLPAHMGSSKAIFDLVEIGDRTEEARRRVDVGIKRLEKERSADLNFPRLLPWRELYQSAQTAGTHDYNTQLLLDPMPEGEQRFAPEDVDAMLTDEIPPPEEMWIYVRVDPAISEKRTADDCAIQATGIDWKGHRYYLETRAWREKRPTEQARVAFSMARRWQAKGYKVVNIGVESVAYQEALAQIMRLGVPSRDMPEGGMVEMLGKPCPIRSIERSPDMRKQERILQMTGAVERREVHVWRANPQAQKVMDEHKQFPFGPDNCLDVCRDAWTGTIVPPRPMEAAKAIHGHPLFRKYLKRALTGKEDTPRQEGLTNVVSLAKWR